MSARWMVTPRGSTKVIHKSNCRYGKHPYEWAGDRRSDELIDALIESGSWSWHVFCRRCCEHTQVAFRRRCNQQIAANVERFIREQNQ